MPSTAQALCHALLPNAASSDTGKWYLNTSALFLWLAVFVLQPHKEERFLYPVYPLVALAAACAVDAAQKIYFRFETNHSPHKICALAMFGLLLI